ncbi:condensation domain-containing protein [Streptomyces sp. NPDC050164]|uniref:condensation domain-containing protein n=1 Tax=Streptomyces sp. NPDC050164 TaxID=3365605 RepID=UPI0037BC71C5
MDEFDFQFRGDRSGEGPMTWGQREQWISICKIAPEDARFNIPFLWEVADGMTIHEVTEGIRQLVARHEALRTHIAGPVENPLQVVHREGKYSVSVSDISRASLDEGDMFDQHDTSLSWNHVRELSGRRFDLAREWPARFRILLGPGKRPKWVCGAISHIAADAAAAKILRRDFEVLMGVDTHSHPTRSPYQPLDRAEYEGSSSGRDFLARAVAQWKKSLQRFPILSYGEPRPHVEGDRYPKVSLYSKSLGEIAQRTAHEWGVWESALFMSASAQALLELTGHSGFPMIVTCANRGGRVADEYVGTIAQQGVAPVAATPSFPDMVKEFWSLLIRMPRHSSYDPVIVGQLIADASGGQFESVDHFVNYRKVFISANADDVTKNFTGSRAFLADGRVPSTFLRFGLMIRSYGRDAQAVLFADRHYIDIESIRSILTRMDDLIRESGSAPADHPTVKGR